MGMNTPVLGSRKNTRPQIGRRDILDALSLPAFLAEIPVTLRFGSHKWRETMPVPDYVAEGLGA